MAAYTIEKQDKGYLLFTIKREEKRNAIDYQVMEGLREAVQLANEKEIKALVITGSGDRAFCSGGDLSVFHALHTKEEAYGMLSRMAELLYSLLTLTKPTLALINGAAVGGGCEVLAACDFRIARSGVKIGFVQGKQAITTGWGGGTIFAEKLMPAKAMKILMEAELFTAEQLKVDGFVDEIYQQSPMPACENFLEKLLAADASVLEAYKKIWIKKWAETRLPERIEEEVRNCAALWESDAHHAYVSSFLKKK